MAFRINVVRCLRHFLATRAGARLAVLIRAALIGAFAAAPLAGCSGGVGSLLTDPARDDAMHCNDLIRERASLISRERELRQLIDKASEGGGGTVIAAVAYRSDYETVLAQERILNRRAGELNCQLTPAYSSDQGIR
jgi:hypothetical protein